VGYVGKQIFELSNQLGNVLATITDKKLQVSTNTTSTAYFEADVQTVQDYYAFGMQMPGRKLSGGYRYGFNGKENDNEVKGEGNQQDYGMRMYDGRIGKFLSVDPLAEKGPQYSPYSAFFNNPIIFTDPDGRWPIYGKDGGYLGDDGKFEKGKDLAFTGTATYDKNGNITGYENLSQFTDNHTQFQIISNIVKHEGVTNDANEYLWVAHTANNAANASGKSLYSKLMSGYSSVGKADKTALSITNNSTTAKYARAGVIDVMSGGADPTGGATLWDGTDFLAWGLNSPNGTPQNKFEEYKSISISGDIYSSFLSSQLGKYTSGKVKYSGTYYNLPADVFTDKANWNKEGNFFFNTGEKQTYGLKATGTAGRSIFWKKEK
jgi:RHS repeat-associated protein